VCTFNLFNWFRASRNKRKTNSQPHPPFNSTERFYIVSLIVAVTGVLGGIDLGGARATTPDALYNVYLGICGSGVNAILVIMVMNWITVMTARGKDTTMLPWVSRLYYFGMIGSLVDVVVTSLEGFTHPIVGAYDGTINGLKHLFLALLEGFFCFIGFYYAISMKNQMSSGGAATEQQKASVARIVGYSRVISICGGIGVLYRTSNFVFRLGKTMYPGPSCSAVGTVIYFLVEFIVFLVVFAVVIAQRPAKAGSGAKVASTTVQSSGTSSTG
jgi:hypothetical protein